MAVVLASCAVTDTKPAFHNAPTYPTTTIQLAGGKSITHQAGRPCTTEERPEVGVSDRERTFSQWQLFGPDRKMLVSAPSFLSDPAFAGEFKDYYRQNDRVDVFESASGNTVVIVEDRSPTFERRAYMLLTKDSQGHWSYRELLLESFAPKSERSRPEFSGPSDLTYPTILEVTDTHLRYTSAKGATRVAIASLPTNG